MSSARFVLSGMLVCLFAIALAPTPLVAGEAGDMRQERRERAQRERKEKARRARSIAAAQERAKAQEKKAEEQLLASLQAEAKKHKKNLSKKEIRDRLSKASKKGQRAVDKEMQSMFGAKRVVAITPTGVGKKVLEKIIQSLVGKQIENPIGLDPQEVGKRPGPAPKESKDKSPRDRSRRIPRDSNERGDLNDHVTA